MVHEGDDWGLELMFSVMTKGGIREAIPLTMINASASQNESVRLVLSHRNVPSAVLALSLDKCQHVKIKFRDCKLRCAVNSGGVSNDNGMKTSLIVEQIACIGILQSSEKFIVVRCG